MIGADIVQFVFFFAILLAIAFPLGWYMASVYEGRQRWLLPVENILYKIVGTKADHEQH